METSHTFQFERQDTIPKLKSSLTRIVQSIFMRTLQLIIAGLVRLREIQ